MTAIQTEPNKTPQSQSAQDILNQLTVDEKIMLLSGKNFWELHGIERLGLPEIMVADGPHGLRKQDLDNSDHMGVGASVPAVCFPTAVGLASTWNTGLINDIGQALGQMCLQERVSVLLGPGVNIKRSPLCGRNFEYYSEDPFLSARFGSAFISGVQSQGVGTSIKHYAANNQEFHRLTVDAVVDERALREIYLPSFEFSVKEAQPWTVMCSYNKINGEYVADSKTMLTDILKDEWDHQGLVVTDWGAANNRVESVGAGLELDMPGNHGIFDPYYKKALASGEMTVAALDNAVLRILKLILKSKDNLKTDYKADLDAQHLLARSAVEQACVLLKNDHATLPLANSESLLVVGEFAKNPRYQGAGSSQINPTQVDIPLTQLESLMADSHSVDFAMGFIAESPNSDQKLIDEAVSKAGEANKIIIFAGLPDSFESEGFDRSHMSLPDNQLQLIDALIATGKSIVIVLQNGSPVELPFKHKVDAILETYLTGQAGGSGVARLLMGHANPSGKLAETFPEKLTDVLAQKWFPGTPQQVQYRESIWVGYRYFDAANVDVAYPFGHGLSYCEFDYKNINVDHQGSTVNANDLPDSDGLTVSVEVTNTSKLAGYETVQLYVADTKSTVFRPQQELKGFDKVWLEAGETKTVSIAIGQRAFSYWCVKAKTWVVEPGDFELRIGGSSRDIHLTHAVTVESADVIALLPAGLERYFEPKNTDFTEGEFVALFGQPIPEILPLRPFHLNSTMTEIKATFIGRKIFEKAMADWLEDEKDDVGTAKMKRMIRSIIAESPLRQMSLMSEGKLSRKRLMMLLDVLNGRYFRAIGKAFRSES